MYRFWYIGFMSKTEFVKELQIWANGDPFREAILIKETPIRPSTLARVIAGSYSPSDLLITALRGVMSKHPLRETPDPEAA